MRFHDKFEYSELTRIPLNTPGRVLRSAQPYGYFDQQGQLATKFKENHVDTVFALISNGELYGDDAPRLAEIYRKKCIKLVHIPTGNYSIPDMEDLEKGVRQAIEILMQGKNIVAHCHAGVGRTGLFLACLIVFADNKSAEDAIEKVRSYIPGAIESQSQIEHIYMFDRLYRKQYWRERIQERKRRKEIARERMRVRGEARWVAIGPKGEGRIYPKRNGTFIVVYRIKGSGIRKKVLYQSKQEAFLAAADRLGIPEHRYNIPTD